MDETQLATDQDRAEGLQFALGLGGLLPLFQPVLQESKEFWKPDDPLPIVLLGDLGSEFARAYPSLDAEARACVLDRIEEGMDPSHHYLSTAVATGFLEGVIHKSERDGTWPSVRLALRPLSLEYADAYVNHPVFNGPPPEKGFALS